MKLTALVTASVFSWFGGPSVDLLDFGKAYYLPNPNEKNNLFIKVEGRSRLSTGEEYVLLAPHPREQTFLNDGKVYTSMLSLDGPSSITFMMEARDGQAIIERRYAKGGQPPNLKHSCTASPYGPMKTQPTKLRSISEITDTAALRSAAADGKKLTALIDYEVAGVEVSTDFQVNVLNDNPAGPSQPGREWQIASSPIPVYVPEAGGCGPFRSGYVAFSDFETTLQFVYLCEAQGIQDYACTVNRPGRVRIFASD